MKQQFGKVNTLHTHVLPWTDRPLVTQNLLGGEEGISRLRAVGLAAGPEPVVLPRGDGRGLSGQLRALPGARAQRPHLRRPPARLSRPHRVHQPRRRRVVRPRAQRRRARLHDARSSASTRPFRYRPLRRAIYRRFIGRTELVWSRREQDAGDVDGVRDVRQRRVPVRAALVRRRRATTGRSAPYDSVARRQGAVAARSPSGRASSARSAASTAARATPKASRRTSSLFQFLFSIGAHGAHAF